MGEFHEVCSLGDIADGRAKAVEIDGLRVAVYRLGDAVFALTAHCPHAGGPMGHGWIEDDEAVCPLHRWRFRLETGRCTTVRGNSLHRFEAKVVEGRVWVAV